MMRTAPSTAPATTDDHHGVTPRAAITATTRDPTTRPRAQKRIISSRRPVSIVYVSARLRGEACDIVPPKAARLQRKEEPDAMPFQARAAGGRARRSADAFDRRPELATG